MTGATFEIKNERSPDRVNLLVVPGAAKLADEALSADDLGPEELILQTVGNDLILAGGCPDRSATALTRANPRGMGSPDADAGQRTSLTRIWGDRGCTDSRWDPTG